MQARINSLSFLLPLSLSLSSYFSFPLSLPVCLPSLPILISLSISLIRLSLFTVPTAPNMVTATSGIRSLTVTWTPPDTPNAPSVNYSVSYTLVDSYSSVNVESDIADTKIVLTGLAAYTEYSVMVQACSSLGCGPFSEYVIQITKEEGV